MLCETRMPRLEPHLATASGRIAVGLASSLLLFSAWSFAANPPPASNDADHRRAVDAMIEQRLGPFSAVRWFCADGTILPPVAYACRPHGGGRQHGQRSPQAEALRAAGIPLANLLAELSPELALAQNDHLLKAVLVEQYLVSTQDGWIFRQSRYQRGATQIEDEVAAATRILTALASEERSVQRDFLLLREALRRLPAAGRDASLDRARALAGTLAERDPGFASLRNKIHSRPDAQDAQAVRRYASRLSRPSDDYAQLAAAIDAVYSGRSVAEALDDFASALRNPAYAEYARTWRQNLPAQARLALLGEILERLRERYASLAPGRRLRALELSLTLEEAAFAAARETVAALSDASRAARLDALGKMGLILSGAGLLSPRERAELDNGLRALATRDSIPLREYRAKIALLERIPVWASNRLSFQLGESIRAFARVAPAAEGLIPDRLRASAALSYGELLETLSADADRLSGVRHELFGQTVSSGLRALNPGLARGTLRTLNSDAGLSQQHGIVLVPESIADLPPVAGILTAAEGNALSHVQLLARNLGVPNVVIGQRWLGTLDPLMGRSVVLAASPGGVVRLAHDGPEWATVFARDTSPAVTIQVDLDKLDLGARQLIPLDQLRAGDSGRLVGPKAAKLGELNARFSGRVSPGLALPFGAFRALLERPMPGESGSVFDWMRASYAQLRRLPEGAQRSAFSRAFLARLRSWIGSTELDPEFLRSLRQALETQFGAQGSFGVFVRSDTNVEDLPGFTGAGLNLTVPHVVGFTAIVQAIRDVWASPFTERAFGWRQALMDQPEHVYAAVLLHQTVPAQLSGVMITADLETGDPAFVTVAVNEGVGGGVEGQAAESLRIALDNGAVELLASATESRRRVVQAGGGTVLEPASGAERLLTPKLIDQLLEVARQLPSKYPQLVDAQGRRAPADVEFAIADGKLYLNQIRPFLQSDRARRNAFLLELDRELSTHADRQVDLRAAP